MITLKWRIHCTNSWTSRHKNVTLSEILSMSVPSKAMATPTQTKTITAFLAVDKSQTKRDMNRLALGEKWRHKRCTGPLCPSEGPSNHLLSFKALMSNKRIEQMIPKVLSSHLALSILFTISAMVLLMPLAELFSMISMPNSSSIWPPAMVMAAAEVKPAVTGTEMKSITKPVDYFLKLI